MVNIHRLKWTTLTLSFPLIILFQNCSSPTATSGDQPLSNSPSSTTDEVLTEIPDDVPEEQPTDVLEKIPTQSCSYQKQNYQCVTISYGDHPLQDYELWLPNNPNNGPETPLVIFVHGGGYFQGDRDYAYRPSFGMREFLNAGYAFATINYRLSGDSPFEKGVTGEFPPAMEDGAAAGQDLKMRASHYGYDPDKIAMTGSSAGGGISLWVAFHDDLKDSSSLDPRDHISTRVPCVALQDTQTTLTIPEVAVLLGEDKFVLDEGLPGLYGFTADEYNSAPEAYNERYMASMQEASAITHISADDNVKVMLTYSLDYNQVNIHSPEFGNYFTAGQPNALRDNYNRNSLSTFGIEFILRTNQASNKQNILEHVMNNCFQ